MPRAFHNLRPAHLYILLGFYLAFAALTFFVLNGGSESERRENAIVMATIGAVSGPMTCLQATEFVKPA